MGTNDIIYRIGRDNLICSTSKRINESMEVGGKDWAV